METLRMIFELSNLDLTLLVKAAGLLTLINAFMRSKILCFVMLGLSILFLLAWKDGGDYRRMVGAIAYFSGFVGALVGYVVGDIFRGKPGNKEE